MPDEDSIDLVRVIDTVLRGRRMIAGIAAAITTLGLLYALLATPVYQADALIQIEERDSDQVGAALDDFAFMLQQATPAETELNIIRSRSVLMPVIEDLRLHIHAEPVYFPLVGRFVARFHEARGLADPVLGLESFAWGGEDISVSRFDVPRKWRGEKFRLEVAEAGSFVLYEPGGTRILDGRVGERVARPVSDELVEGIGGPVEIEIDEIAARSGTRFELIPYEPLKALEELREDFSAGESGRDTAVINLAYTNPDPEIAARVLGAIARSYLEQNIKRNSLQAEERARFIERQLPEILAELRSAEKLFSEYRASEGTIDISVQAEELIKQYAEVETRLSELALQKEEERNLFTPTHPRMRAIGEQKRELEGRLAELDRTLRSLPESEQDYVQLQRDVTVGNELYLQLLSKLQEFRVMSGSEIGNVRIVDEPMAPIEHLRPNRPLVVAISLALGLFAGLLAVFVRRLLDQGIEDPEQLERSFDIPLYSVVPHSAQQEKYEREFSRSGKPVAPLLATLAGSDPAIEAMRSLRTSLQFALMDADNPIVALTGPSEGIGKTFVSVNLAAVIAPAGKRVLLIDADMRRGRIHRVFSGTRTPGLSQAIADEISWPDAIHRTDVDNLDFIPTGIIPPNPSELLTSEGFARGIRDLAAHYDLVLVDTPPVLAVSDTLVVGRLCGSLFMVVKSGVNSLGEIRHAVGKLSNNGVRVHGFIFNDLQRSGLKSYGYYHYEYAASPR